MTTRFGIAAAALLAMPVMADTRYAPTFDAIVAAQAVAVSMADTRLRDTVYAGLQEADAVTGARDCRILNSGLEQSWLIMSGHVARALTSDAQLQPVLERAARQQKPPAELLTHAGQVAAVEDLIDRIDKMVERSGPLVLDAGYAEIDMSDGTLILTHDCP